MKKIDLSTAYQIGCSVCSAFAAILQTLAVLLSYNTTDHYFQSGSLLSVFAVIFAFVGAGLGVGAVCSKRNETVTRSIFSRTTFPNPIACGAAVSAILFGGYRLFSQNNGSAFSRFDLCLTVCLLLMVAYAVLSGIRGAAKKTTLTAFFGLFSIVACILFNAYYYFDNSIEMNAPLKTSVQVGLLFATLYLTGEIRYLLGTQMPRMMQLFAVCTVSFGALSAIAVPVAFFSEKLNRPDYLAGAILVLGFVLTAIIRLRTLRHFPQKTTASLEDVNETTE